MNGSEQKKVSVDYESRKAARKRAEVCYPSPALKDQLNTYCEATGVSKSGLMVMLLKSYFKARKTEGQEPTSITLIPQ